MTSVWNTISTFPADLIPATPLVSSAVALVSIQTGRAGPVFLNDVSVAPSTHPKSDRHRPLSAVTVSPHSNPSALRTARVWPKVNVVTGFGGAWTAHPATMTASPVSLIDDMSLSIAVNDTPSFLDGVRSRYAEKSSEASVEIACEKGEVFTFRQFKSESEIDSARKEAAAFADRVMEGKVPKAFADAAPKDPETLRYVFYLALLNTGVSDPAQEGEERKTRPPLTQKEWCEVAKELPMLFNVVRHSLDDKLSVFAVSMAVKGVAEAKKGSSPTTDGGSGSASDVPSGESTPTNLPEQLGAST